MFLSLSPVALRGAAYLVHAVHQLGDVEESLGAAHQTLLFDVDGLGQLPDVQLSHLFERCLTFESLERHWGNRGEADVKHIVYF